MSRGCQALGRWGQLRLGADLGLVGTIHRSKTAIILRMRITVYGLLHHDELPSGSGFGLCFLSFNVCVDVNNFNCFNYIDIEVGEQENESFDLNEKLVKEGVIFYLFCELNDLLTKCDDDYVA